MRELEEELDKKTLENEVLTEAVKLAHKKKLISRTPLLLEDDSLLSGALRTLTGARRLWNGSATFTIYRNITNSSALGSSRFGVETPSVRATANPTLPICGKSIHAFRIARPARCGCPMLDRQVIHGYL